MICHLAKNENFHTFVDRSLKDLSFYWKMILFYCRNFYNTVLRYAESYGVIFVKILWLLGVVSPYFLKWGKFSKARNFWWVRLNLMKLIYLKSALKCEKKEYCKRILIPVVRSKESYFNTDFKYISFVKFSLAHQKLRAWENLPCFRK